MREYIVFSKEHYNPTGIVRTLGEMGINPIVISFENDYHMISKSKYVKESYVVSNVEEGIDLIIKKYTNPNNEKNFILTGDDLVCAALNANYDKLINNFYFYNAGEQGRVNYFMDKEIMGQTAEKHGFKIPRTWKIVNKQIPDDIVYPVMTKAANSYSDEWKNIVFICKNQDELINALSKIKSECIILQQYILKVDEESFEGFSVNHGKDVFFSVQNNEVYHLEDRYAPFWKNKNVTDEVFMKKAKEMLADIGFEGIFEFEFIVDGNGDRYFMEINFRNTANGWTTTVAGMPNAELWTNSMLQGYIDKNCYREIPEGFTTMAECYDYDVRVKGQGMNIEDWLAEYEKVNAKLYKGRNDDEPFIAFMKHKTHRD